MGTAGGAFSERAARCPRAQYGGGGVILMDKGTVLFDGVAISGSEADVRIGGQRCAWGRSPADARGRGEGGVDGVWRGCGSGVRRMAAWSR